MWPFVSVRACVQVSPGRALQVRHHQLHRQEGFESDDAEIGWIVDCLNLRGRQQMIGARLFTGEQEVDGLTGLALRTVAEHGDVEHFAGDKARLLKGGRDGRQITPADRLRRGHSRRRAVETYDASRRFLFGR